MRRANRQVSNCDAIKILMYGEYGFLSTISNDNTPYITPLNYVYYDKAIYFHSANDGHKLDNIKYNSAVCFSVVIGTCIIPEKFTSKYQSVTIFGKAEILDNDDSITPLMEIIKKYSCDFIDEGKKEIEKYKGKTTVVKITIEHISGKSNK